MSTSTSEANLYQPTYTDTTVKSGDTATITPTLTDSTGAVVTPPVGIQFTSPSLPIWATIDLTTGTITAKPGTDVLAGTNTIPVTVTYLDGTTDVVEAKITVTSTQADTNTPVAQDQTVKVGETPKVEDSIANLPELPTGTTVSYETPVDTSTAGTKDAVVVVTYPDGSVDKLPVSIAVVENPTQAGTNKNNQVGKNQTIKPLSNIVKDSDKENSLPTTGENVNPFFNIATLSIIASVGLIAIPKKKED